MSSLRISHNMAEARFFHCIRVIPICLGWPAIKILDTVTYALGFSRNYLMASYSHRDIIDAAVDAVVDNHLAERGRFANLVCLRPNCRWCTTP